MKHSRNLIATSPSAVFGNLLTVQVGSIKDPSRSASWLGEEDYRE